MTGKEWVARRNDPASPEPGMTCFLFPPGGHLIRWSFGTGTVLFDKEGCADDQTPEPYMGYTPGEDDPPERGAFPGERYMA